MSPTCTSSVTETVERAIAALDLDRLERDYWDQNEFLYIPQFLPREKKIEKLNKENIKNRYVRI